MSEPADLLHGRVLRAQSGFFQVQTDAGVLTCRLRGRLKKERQQSDIAVIGDAVRVRQVLPGEGAIEEILPRHSRFSRQQPGPRGQWKEDVLVANLDLVCTVFACAHPSPRLRMLDRFLVVAEYNEVTPLIIANKADLLPPAEAVALFADYPAAGYRVLLTSTVTGAGIDELRVALAGQVSVFTGPSGVGKSSLLNALQPGLGLQTGTVSAAVNKGRHTTVVAELHDLHGVGGGYVADTPGIRELAGWQIPASDLAWCFPELRPYLGDCDFNDCSHTHEPGCAVRAAVDAGRVSAARYDSYVRQLTGEPA